MRLLRIIGLGPGAAYHVPGRNVEAMKSSRTVFLRTSVHPTADMLRGNHVDFKSFDSLFEECSSFDEVYRGICDAVLGEASRGGIVAYAVPGHPFFGEATVGMVIEGARDRGIRYEVYPAMSFLDSVVATLEIDPLSGLEIADASGIVRNPPLGNRGVILSQVYNERIASDVRLTLMTRYPERHTVALVSATGAPGGDRVVWVPVCDIDKQPVGQMTTVYVPPLQDAPRTIARASEWPLDPIVGVIARLRGENGCPWDREQTHRSLRPYVIEEAYEVVEAIDLGDMNKLCDELGDLLLQVVLHSRIAQENGDFDVNDVVDGVTRKMIRRHVHVFGGDEARTSGEVIDKWDAIKRRERGEGDEPVIRVLEGLPALMRAYKVQKAAARVGFDWRDVRDVLVKVEEEIEELREVLESGDAGRTEEEAGDVLFSVVNLCRFLKVNPEVALTRTVSKFAGRFGYIEAAAARMGRNLAGMSLEEMDALWEESKE